VIAPDRPTTMAPWLERAWLMRYLDRQLGSDEQAWFEGYLLDKPELLDQLEADTALRDAVGAQPAACSQGAAGDRTTVAEGSAQGQTYAGPHALGPDQASAEILARRQAQSQPVGDLGGRWLALAAGLVAGIGLMWIGTTLDQDGGAALVVNPPRIIFDTLRGQLTDPRVEPGDPASPVMVVEVPVPPGASAASARLQGPETGVDIGPVSISPDGFALLIVPADAVGEVVLVHDADGDIGPAEVRFPLPALRPPQPGVRD
jgi:hypothetical protein